MKNKTLLMLALTTSMVFSADEHMSGDGIDQDTTLMTINIPRTVRSPEIFISGDMGDRPVSTPESRRETLEIASRNALILADLVERSLKISVPRTPSPVDTLSEISPMTPRRKARNERSRRSSPNVEENSIYSSVDPESVFDGAASRVLAQESARMELTAVELEHCSGNCSPFSWWIRYGTAKTHP
jgi:hypothetical protein